MKIKVTRKFVNSYGKVKIHIPAKGYLFGGLTADWYNCGAYGWNWDAWNLPGFIVIEGYRSFPSCITADYELFKSFDRRAKELSPLDTAALDALRLEFCAAVANFEK